jgi:hypothetical protein
MFHALEGRELQGPFGKLDDAMNVLRSFSNSLLKPVVS